MMTSIFTSVIKKLLLIKYILLTVLLFTIISCANKTTSGHIKEESYNPNEYLIIWAHSDIQPRDLSERKYYESAIADINNNFPKIDIALVAGDIVHYDKSTYDFEWYIEKKKNSIVKHWYEIAGNHDQKNYKNYKKYIQLPLHYSVRIGNILILCLSDEDRYPTTKISDEAFNWWKEMVVNNQDKIIITMTHGYVKQSNLFGTVISSRNINNSDRFADVLKNYKVDIWLCGHTHLSHSINASVKTADKLNGTLFINVSAIRGRSFLNTESFLLYFKKDSNEAIIKSRNHTEQKFNMDSILHKLNRPFIWNGTSPIIQKMDYDIP